MIAPGTYDLSGVDFPNGVDGRLTVGRFGAGGIIRNNFLRWNQAAAYQVDRPALTRPTSEPTS